MIGWWYKTFQSSFGLGLRTNKITPQWYFRSRMRAFHPSSESPTGDVWSDILQLPFAHARSLPREYLWGDVWWRHFRWKGPTRVDIAQLPVAHAHTQGNPKGITWLTSLPVAMLLVLLYYLYYILYYYYSKKKAREAEKNYDGKSGMRRIYFRSRDWLHFRLGPVTSLPVAPPQILFCPSPYILPYLCIFTPFKGEPYCVVCWTCVGWWCAVQCCASENPITSVFMNRIYAH